MVLLLLLLSIGLTLPAAAANVRMAFGDNFPPAILVSSSSGIEVDVVREALAYRGHVLQPVFMPMGPIPLVFVAGKADAIMMDAGQDMGPAGGLCSEVPVVYDNGDGYLGAAPLARRHGPAPAVAAGGQRPHHLHAFCCCFE